MGCGVQQRVPRMLGRASIALGMGLRLEFRNGSGYVRVVANFVALEQEIILVKTRSESV